MTTSGTYAYLPSCGELIAAAYRRVGIHRSELVTEHFADAMNETNLLQAEWANEGPLLWTVALQSVDLVEGTQTYTVPVNTVMVLDVYISIPNQDGTSTDRVITPMSRSEYAAMPEKLQQGAPTCYWFDRLISPSIYLWPTPDGYGPYTMNYYTFSQVQDAALVNATQPQIPYLWLDAYVAGLAHRFAMIYAPPMEQARLIEAKRAYNIASTQGTEGTSLFLAPNCSSYWRH